MLLILGPERSEELTRGPRKTIKQDPRVDPRTKSEDGDEE